MQNMIAIEKGITQIKNSLESCGIGHQSMSVSLAEILADDEGGVGFTLEILMKSYQTDTGVINPPAAIIELYYNKDTDEISMVVSEDTEWPITYGNVFSFLYFNSLST